MNSILLRVQQLQPHGSLSSVVVAACLVICWIAGTGQLKLIDGFVYEYVSTHIDMCMVDSQRVHPLGRSVQLARNGFHCIALSTQFYHSRQSSSPSAFAFLISPSNVIQRNLESRGDFGGSKQNHLTSARDHLLRRSLLLLLSL